MADNNFRSYRSRDPGAPVAPSARTPVDDPLAELARLIGQGDAGDDYGQSYNNGAPLGGMDWAANDRYADRAPAPQHSGAPRQAESHRSNPRSPALPPRDDQERAAPRRRPEPPPRYNVTRDDPHDYAPVDQPPYRDEQAPPEPRGRHLPGVPLRAQDVRYEREDVHQDGADDQNYALEEYEEEAPRRRGGFVVVAAVLGLAVLGTAGAFAYRAMFGGSMLPSLPPIIKAEDGPNKIVPNASDSHGTPPRQTAAASAGEKLVSREEKPVDVPAPVTTAPRVVSTIPVFPAPTPGAPGAPPAGAMPSNVLTPFAPAPAAPEEPVVQAPALAAPPPPAPAVPAPSPPDLATAPAPLPPVSGTKKIHTVTIRPDQPDGGDAMAAPPPPPAPAPAARAAAPAPRAAAQPAPRSPVGANTPLAIVPPQGGAPSEVAPRARTAAPRPMPLATASAAPSSEPAGSTGGYAVQVTSQRSEAEAQSAYRALAAKYPNQLGGHVPIVRRADLGAKGIYYRALVGPFASMEQAAGMCSSLKAAGGNCIVQKN